MLNISAFIGNDVDCRISNGHVSASVYYLLVHTIAAHRYAKGGSVLQANILTLPMRYFEERKSRRYPHSALTKNARRFRDFYLTGRALGVTSRLFNDFSLPRVD
jgi:hypothetical protein